MTFGEKVKAERTKLGMSQDAVSYTHLIDFKGCTVFRCRDLCFSVIGMLDDGDITFHNLLCNICLLYTSRCV